MGRRLTASMAGSSRFFIAATRMGSSFFMRLHRRRASQPRVTACRKITVFSTATCFVFANNDNTRVSSRTNCKRARFAEAPSSCAARRGRARASRRFAPAHCDSVTESVQRCQSRKRPRNSQQRTNCRARTRKAKRTCLRSCFISLIRSIEAAL